MSRIVVGAVGAVLVLLLTAAAPSLSGTATRAAQARQAKPAIRADLDRDKLFDDLEATMRRARPQQKLRVIVSLRVPASRARLRRLQRAIGPVAVSHRYTIFKGFAARMSISQVRALVRLRQVRQIEQDATVHALNDTAQASFGVTKARLDDPALDGNCSDASKPDCAPGSYGPDDLVAAVIDTGIYAAHRDLDQGKVIAFKDFVGTSTTPYDDNGHGTHVAATIAGDGDARPDHLYKGVAPAAALVGVKVLNSQGSGQTSNVDAAINWVVQNKDVYGIEAINLSLGISGCSNGTDSTSQAVNAAAAAGIVVAVSAGNSGPGTCTIGSPAAAAGAISVGAMADLGENGFKQAYFSSRGRTLDGRIKPDVSAPGVSITSARTGTADQYIVYSGTSMAAPFVTGVALLLRDESPGLTPQQVKDDIMSTAVDWGRGGDSKTAGTNGLDIDYGAGRLDAYAALAAAGAPLSAPPDVPLHQLKEGSLSGTGATVDYPLNVTDARFPIAATLIVPSISGSTAASPDFDLYLYNPSGSQVASALTSRRQDELGYRPPTIGTYTLRVRSYTGSGAYFIDLSAGLSPPPPPTPDFSVAASPSSASTNPGGSVSFAVSVSALNGYSGSESLSVSGLPAGATGTFSPSSVSVPPSPASSTLGIATTSATAPGSYPLTINATGSGGTSRAAQVTLVVNSPAVTGYPTTVTVETGTRIAGNASSLSAADASYYQVQSNTLFTRTASWYGGFGGVPSTLKTLNVTYQGKSSRSCTQGIYVLRWSTGSWVQVDSRSVSTTEQSLSIDVAGTLSAYVSNGNLRVRVRCQTTTGTFTTSGNLLRISYTP